MIGLETGGSEEPMNMVPRVPQVVCYGLWQHLEYFWEQKEVLLN